MVDHIKISTEEASNIVAFLKKAHFGHYGELSEERQRELAVMERKLLNIPLDVEKSEDDEMTFEYSGHRISEAPNAQRRIYWMGKDGVYSIFKRIVVPIYHKLKMLDRMEADFNDYWQSENPIYSFFEKFANQCLFECKRVAYGMGSKFTNYQTIKMRTGKLAASLTLSGPSHNDYYDFFIDVIDYYKFVAGGRKYKNNVVKIPIGQVYNKTAKDERIAAMNGGFTFRKISPQKMTEGSEPSPFIDSIMSIMWQDYSEKLPDIIADASQKYVELIKNRYGIK